MQDEADYFEDFWQASSLDQFNIQGFGALLGAYDSDEKNFGLSFPGVPTPLSKARSSLGKIAKKRTSQRAFTDAPISEKELSQLLASFAYIDGPEHRTYPSAGATYCTEIFCVSFRAEKYEEQILYYDAESHRLVRVGKAPKWQEIKHTVNIEITGEPAAMLVLVSFPERATAKYGERGARFALLEAGAAMQQLALQIADSRSLKGVAVGGLFDDFWKQKLGLDKTKAHIVLGYLVGK